MATLCHGMGWTATPQRRTRPVKISKVPAPSCARDIACGSGASLCGQLNQAKTRQLKKKTRKDDRTAKPPKAPSVQSCQIPPRVSSQDLSNKVQGVGEKLDAVDFYECAALSSHSCTPLFYQIAAILRWLSSEVASYGLYVFVTDCNYYGCCTGPSSIQRTLSSRMSLYGHCDGRESVVADLLLLQRLVGARDDCSFIVLGDLNTHDGSHEQFEVPT
eukprot:4733427-Amphidinium_carterae.2